MPNHHTNICSHENDVCKKKWEPSGAHPMCTWCHHALTHLLHVAKKLLSEATRQ